ncbi:hypothetical protein RHSIM_Rhsim12G0163500 [Rhododendron simsii]|uniref:RING-type domain-containing protein n=1 Tax=Rhododendron simsii TaxID=118357 RepID=A0A834L969_RHOSS|nr:hypothetical protein RHSIM_Rhsim12G0163500 [Rhododendron simsii]
MDIAVSVILVLAVLAVMVTIHVCVVARALRGGFDINPANTVGRLNSSRRPNMSSNDIGKLPSFDYKLEEKRRKSSHMECAICLECFKEGEMCRLLPNCQHSFHAQCIDSWLLKAAICPVCRANANLVNTDEHSRNPGEVGVDSV